MPSLYKLHVRQMLPERFVILELRGNPWAMTSSVCLSVWCCRSWKEKDWTGRGGSFLAESVLPTFWSRGRADELGERVMFLMEENAIPMRVVFGNPPNSQQAITKYIGRSCLFGVKAGRVASDRVEKPFGTSLELRKNWINPCCRYSVNRDYRIDHFWEGDGTIYWLRFANEIFESLWNRNYVDYVEIYAWNRSNREPGKYYETTGACGIWCRTIWCSCWLSWLWNSRRRWNRRWFGMRR